MIIATEKVEEFEDFSEEEEVEGVEGGLRVSTSATVPVERTFASEDSTVSIVSELLEIIVCSDWPFVRSKVEEPPQEPEVLKSR